MALPLRPVRARLQELAQDFRVVGLREEGGFQELEEEGRFQVPDALRVDPRLDVLPAKPPVGIQGEDLHKETGIIV
jgi:hypothetical protein